MGLPGDGTSPFAEGGDNQHYYKFWGNAIRWLIRDQAHPSDDGRDRCSLKATPQPVPIG